MLVKNGLNGDIAAEYAVVKEAITAPAPARGGSGLCRRAAHRRTGRAAGVAPDPGRGGPKRAGGRGGRSRRMLNASGTTSNG